MATPNYYEDLFTPEQMSDLRWKGVSQGLLGLGQALSQAGAPSLMPQGSGLSQGLAAFNQAYQGQVDKTLQDMLKGAQVKEMITKQKQNEQLRKLYASAMTPQYQVTPAVVPQGQTALDEMGMPTYGTVPEQKTLTGYKYDMKQIVPVLQAMGRFDELKGIAEAQKAVRQAGLTGDQENAPSPFAPYLSSASPNVQILANQYQNSYNRGLITEEQANQALQGLGRMDESYQARMDARLDRQLTREAAGKPTEGEKNAAGFAQRMEFSEGKLKEIEGKVAQAQIEGKKAGTPYATTETELVGSIPFIGEWARGKKQTTQQQLYRQAQENWVRANLRKESGAVIGSDEMNKEIATYFPMPTDKPETIAQKEQARKVTMDAMKMAAGKAYEPFNFNQFVKNNDLERRR